VRLSRCTGLRASRSSSSLTSARVGRVVAAVDEAGRRRPRGP
jgi:hypothetical protein